MNADFRTSANQTRVKYLCDQTGVGDTEPDGNGHGTHIAGITAGNGRATGGGGYRIYRYIALAPEADVVVKSYLHEVIDGVNYIFQKARSLGKDGVVLVSAGNNRGRIRPWN